MTQFRHMVALGLALMLLLIMGSFHVQGVSHAADHQHHSAKTHTTGICAWMCAATQTITADSHVLSPNFLPLDLLTPFEGKSPPSLCQTFLPSRAPPPL